MNRRNPLALLTLLAAGLFVLSGTGNAQDKKEPDKHEAHHAKAYDDCAKACNDCQRACDSCARHCAMLLAAGKKEHLKSLGTCADCADHCSAAAHIVSRQGPMARNICEACAKACDVCATECEKFKEDEHMKQCAAECRRCAKACHEMMKLPERVTESK